MTSIDTPPAIASAHHLHSNAAASGSPAATPLWVLDTNVVLDWLLFHDRHVHAIAQAIAINAARIVCRNDCRDELVRVLQYPNLRFDPGQRAQALVAFDAVATVWTGEPLEPALPRCKDPDDQKFLELARDCSAKWLITKDRMLLNLGPSIRRLQLFDIIDPQEANRLLLFPQNL